MAIDLLMQMREYFLLGVGHRAMKKDEKRGQQALRNLCKTLTTMPV
jgi:hypothetical protein